uniref:Reverse transcriptase domain-containing protein n=1 Tax=Tanacetum cinerariifolium TaxID=118510 RepID=A0A6L2KVU9_TANCI|nr:reverse transcriptase domain-containing protein [Tanacetum cinerariifolium]
MQEVVKKEIVKLLDIGIIYLIADSPWVSPIHCVPKKDGITVVTNENDELVPTRTVMGKGTKNVDADHLSQIENEKTSDDSEVDDNFPGETFMEINTKNEPWFADFENYLVADIIPKGMTYNKRTNSSLTSNTISGRNPIFSTYVLTFYYGCGERYFGENSFYGLLIPYLLSSSLFIWLIEAIFSRAIDFPVDLGIVEFSDWIAFFLGGIRNHLIPFQASFGVGCFIEIPWSLVVLGKDELPSNVGLDFQARLDVGRMYSGHLEANVLVTKLTTGRLVNGSSCDGIDMVVKNFDLEPKDIIAEFYGPSQWKELSKEMSSKILPYGDGSCWKMFKPIASLIAKGKLK